MNIKIIIDFINNTYQFVSLMSIFDFLLNTSPAFNFKMYVTKHLVA